MCRQLELQIKKSINLNKFWKLKINQFTFATAGNSVELLEKREIFVFVDIFKVLMVKSDDFTAACEKTKCLSNKGNYFILLKLIIKNLFLLSMMVSELRTE